MDLAIEIAKAPQVISANIATHKAIIVISFSPICLIVVKDNAITKTKESQ